MSVPSAPTITSITPSSGSLSVSFTAPVSSGGAAITNYEISLNNGASWTNIGPSPSSPIPVNFLTAGTTYQVKLRAGNGFGSGADSNMVEGTTLVNVPSMPFITSTTPGDSQLTINFSPPTSNGGAPITDYKYSLDNGSTWTSSGSTSSPIVVTGLTNGTTYQLKLRAVNSAGDGAQSIQFSETPIGLAGAPTIDSVEAGDAVLFVNFTAPVSNGGSDIIGYVYSTDNGSTWVDSGMMESPIAIYMADEDNSLINGTTYQVLVRAITTSGNGASSNMVVATPIEIVMSSLKANGSDIVLNGDGYYGLTLPEGTTSVTIEAIPVDSNLTVTVIGADSLTNNAYNTVTCEITSPSGTVLRTINIDVLVGTYTDTNTGASFDPTPVEVNLNVNVNAQGSIEVFGEGKPTIAEYIIAEKGLPVDALYDEVAKKGLIEIWEPSAAEGDIKAALADSNKTVSGGEDFSGAYKLTAKKLALGLEDLLCDSFDCINALPFSGYTEVEYTTQRDFGRVALAAYAHALFGHVDATAAITNDKAFVESMLSVSAAGDDETAGGAALRAAAFTKVLGDGTVDPMTWDSASSATDANLAVRLVQAVVSKGVSAGSLVESSVQAVTNINTDATLANIVRQVVGQDSNRLINVDNSQRTKDIRQLLRFYAGDVIYVNITLQVPSVSIGSAYSGALTGSSIASRFTEKNYTVKITLV